VTGDSPLLFRLFGWAAKTAAVKYCRQTVRLAGAFLYRAHRALALGAFGVCAWQPTARTD
jgi:hypothetical protein